MENKTVTIKALVSFPSWEREDQFSNKYGVQLCNLSDKAVETLEELGVNVREEMKDYNRGRFIQCKSNFPINNNGKFPLVFLPDGARYEGLMDDVGYGSKVRAVLDVYEWTYAGKSGVGARIKKLTIDEINEPEVKLQEEQEAL
jgi:hypothetical protein